MPFTFNADGSLRLSGGVTLFTSDGNPNDSIAGLQAGDLCLTTEPALYQWSGGATPAWISGSSFDGSFTGTAGILLRDASGDGITIQEENDGGFIELVADSVALDDWLFTAEALAFPQPGGGLANHLFTSAADPSGTISAIAIGDLCVTNEPALYQATAADNSHWTPYEFVNTHEAIYHFSLSTTSPFGQIFETGTVKLVGGATPGPEYVDFTVSVPTFTYPAGTISQGINIDLFDLPPSSHAFAVEMIEAVVSLDGLNSLVVQVTYTGAPNADTLDVSPPFGATVGQVGTDLTWDDDFGTITSAAGGTYGIMTSFQTHWV